MLLISLSILMDMCYIHQYIKDYKVEIDSVDPGWINDQQCRPGADQ